MQIGLAQLIGGLVAIALLIGGAFSVGLKISDDDSAETAAAVSALESDDDDSSEDIVIPVPPDAPPFKVLRVVDGDTIVIEVNGKSESVRMIGVDTPELNDSRTGVQCFAKEASEKTKSLVVGKNIRLEKDTSQGERDKYRRLLGYVFLESGEFVNLELIKGGFAHEYTYDDIYKYQKEFKTAESEARTESVGLWAPDICPPAKTAKTKTPVTIETGSQTAAAAAAPKVQPVQQPVAEPASLPPPTQTMQPPSPPLQQEPPLTLTPSQPSNGSFICTSNTYNCSDFKTKKEAQEAYDQCGGVGNDIHRLDNNKDGSACDSLP